jgi:hypothetical protein
MLFKNALLITASAALAQATENIVLSVKSDNTEVNGNSLGFLHEGAGISYAFLTTSGPTDTMVYDETAKTISDPNAGFSFPIAFGVSGNYVQIAVLEPGVEFSFNGDTLLANGTANVFYACKDTNDPYNYSSNSHHGYELMYYSSNAPSACIPVNLVKSAAPASSSVVPTSSSTTHASSSSISTFPGAGANMAPAGAFAAIAGVAAALI